MKKVISVFLALTIALSSFFCVNVFAAEGSGSVIEDIFDDITNMENFENSIITGSSGFIYPEDADYDVDKMIENGEIEGEMLGITLDFLYNESAALAWGKLDVSRDDLSLARANVNTYLQRLLVKKLGGFNLFSMTPNEKGIPAASYYATVITNFLGNLFYPNYTDKTISFEGTEHISSDEFYGTIVTESGFGELLQYNWCNQIGVDFRPMIETWGLKCENVLKSEYRDGFRLGKKLVAAVINKFIDEGPVNAMLDIIHVYSRSYYLYLYDATLALFSLRVSAGDVTPEELKSLHEIFNIVFNGNNEDDTSKLQFVQMPTNRFRTSVDKTELFLYLIVYFNINSKYKDNESVIEGYKSQVNSMKLSADDKATIKSIIDGVLKGDLKDLVSRLSALFSKNVTETPNVIFKSIKNAIAAFFKKIVDYFDNLFKMLSGEKEFPRWD